MHSCGHQICQQPVVCVPFCVWDVGCATTSQHSCFNQLTNLSIQFSSHLYVSLPGKTTSVSVISNIHAEARSWKRAPWWWISQKKRTPKFPGRVLYRTVSVHCTINTERQACEVQRLLLHFLGLFCCPWWNVQHRTTCHLEASHQQRKNDRKYAEDFPLIFMGCDIIRAETLFTNFFVVHNIALCSRSWHLFWRTFPQKRIAKEDHNYMYATLRI